MDRQALINEIKEREPISNLLKDSFPDETKENCAYIADISSRIYVIMKERCRYRNYRISPKDVSDIVCFVLLDALFGKKFDACDNQYKFNDIAYEKYFSNNINNNDKWKIFRKNLKYFWKGLKQLYKDSFKRNNDF